MLRTIPGSVGEKNRRTGLNKTLTLDFFPCRQTTLVVYIMSLVGMIAYTFTLSLGHLWVVFVTAGMLG